MRAATARGRRVVHGARSRSRARSASQNAPVVGVAPDGAAVVGWDKAISGTGGSPRRGAHWRRGEFAPLRDVAQLPASESYPGFASTLRIAMSAEGRATLAWTVLGQGRPRLPAPGGLARADRRVRRRRERRAVRQRLRRALRPGQGGRRHGAARVGRPPAEVRAAAGGRRLRRRPGSGGLVADVVGPAGQVRRRRHGARRSGRAPTPGARASRRRASRPTAPAATRRTSPSPPPRPRRATRSAGSTASTSTPTATRPSPGRTSPTSCPGRARTIGGRSRSGSSTRRPRR